MMKSNSLSFTLKVSLWLERRIQRTLLEETISPLKQQKLLLQITQGQCKFYRIISAIYQILYFLSRSTLNVHPLLSSMINYTHPIKFQGWKDIWNWHGTHSLIIEIFSVLNRIRFSCRTKWKFSNVIFCWTCSLGLFEKSSYWVC